MPTIVTIPASRTTESEWQCENSSKTNRLERTKRESTQRRTDNDRARTVTRSAISTNDTSPNLTLKNFEKQFARFLRIRDRFWFGEYANGIFSANLLEAFVIIAIFAFLIMQINLAACHFGKDKSVD
jgi:hypothetical protein